MKILDLKKDLKYLYGPSAKKPEIVQVPRLHFAMIDGAIEKGYEPGNSPSFQEATQALYAISYTLKFMLKKRKTYAIDYPVMALQGLWWVEDGRFDITVKDNWFYTLMILQPDVITQGVFEEGRAEVRRKKGDNASLSNLRLADFEEGTCVQVMHMGPYATEPATVERMRDFARENGYRDLIGSGIGKHHEIYLGDPRKADPAKLKTILRHPVEKVN
ncbi:MAG TPA: GyrI-like domain-containing protein [Anaerolineales bacterium]|nr:GyrI-like domain-containing protein [Anaerolineales bacterium]